MYIVCRHSGYTVGIKGVVTDENNEPVEGAEVRVFGREAFAVKTTAEGEYWRLLLPGTYTLKVGKISPTIRYQNWHGCVPVVFLPLLLLILWH